jgi:poly(hydroxyalkanoate) depolymerase family esterase
VRESFLNQSNLTLRRLKDKLFVPLHNIIIPNINSVLFIFSKKILIAALFLFLRPAILYPQSLVRVKHFGKNKGHLKMYVHIPPNLNNADKRMPLPLVVVLHGCTQCASTVSKQTGWNKLADENNFYMLYPQQRSINNPIRCFRFYKRKHTNKNRGENYSIEQMIEYMKNKYTIDSSKVFITGLSAGAAMSVVMMADYPETFNAGAIFAGGAYKIGTGYITATMGLLGWRIKSAERWGAIVRKQNPDFKGEYPRMIIYQGNRDWLVNRRNGRELMKQWTNVHHIGIEPSETIKDFVNNKDIERNVYRNSDKKDVVIFYKINKLNHALLIDPGKCQQQGGKRGLFSKDKNYYSTIWTAYDFGLIPTPIITGKTMVSPKEQNITYTVPLNIKSTYQWTFPNGCTVVKNDNTNSIILNWGNSSGNINVTEADALFCKKQYQTLFVNVVADK